MKKTLLYDCHKELGAKFVEFGGWQMPVRYSGQIQEHHAVRNKAGLFDVSHMGEIFVTGPSAKEFLNYVCSNKITKLKKGKAQYNLLLNHEGGVVDDVIVYKFSKEKYLVCVNASNADKDFDWLNKNKEEKYKEHDLKLENKSNKYSQIAIQGPLAISLVSEVLKQDLSDISNFAFKEISELIVARTGYTGEDGLEIFCPNENAIQLWKDLVSAGKDDGVLPVGLGARDTLRLEAGLPLHGHELRDDINAVNSNMRWSIKLEKDDFIGKKACETEPEYKLIGVEVLDKGIVRDGTKIYKQSQDGQEQEIGWVTSGTLTPTLNKAIALCYLKLGFVNIEDGDIKEDLFAVVRNRKLKLGRLKLPFYKRSES